MTKTACYHAAALGQMQLHPVPAANQLAAALLFAVRRLLAMSTAFAVERDGLLAGSKRVQVIAKSDWDACGGGQPGVRDAEG